MLIHLGLQDFIFVIFPWHAKDINVMSMEIIHIDGNQWEHKTSKVEDLYIFVIDRY